MDYNAHMSLHKEEFSIAGINYEIISNFDVHNLLWEPQPYNLNINYHLGGRIKNKKVFTIFINNTIGKVRVSTSGKKIKISGNINLMFEKGYNQQFGLFGNKGIINKFILHTLEKYYGITTFHASAIVHPSKLKICIAVGASGSGKSVFVCNAIQSGWKSIATEHVLIGEGRIIFRGNKFDNLSPRSAELYKKDIPSVEIFKDKTLVEPVGSKIFANLAGYSAHSDSYNLEKYDVNLVVLNFMNDSHKAGTSITDKDFLLRTMQQTASEKVVFPAIFSDEILPVKMEGNPIIRSSNINYLIRSSDARVVLGGDHDDFKAWLKIQYEN